MTKKKGQKIGLYFGSFNPIHIGHLAIANYMLEFTNLDQIWFVVSPHNPLKKKRTLLADHHRLEMVNIAVENQPNYKASNIEFKLTQPSYTINTLAYLQEKHPEYNFVLIMGSDSLETLPQWKNYEQILSLFNIYVYPRPGFNSQFHLASHESVKIVNAPLMEISSSFIRKAIKDGKNVQFFLPEKVYQYINEMNFYKK